MNKKDTTDKANENSTTAKDDGKIKNGPEPTAGI